MPLSHRPHWLVTQLKGKPGNCPEATVLWLPLHCPKTFGWQCLTSGTELWRNHSENDSLVKQTSLLGVQSQTTQCPLAHFWAALLCKYGLTLSSESNLHLHVKRWTGDPYFPPRHAELWSPSLSGFSHWFTKDVNFIPTVQLSYIQFLLFDSYG